MPFGLPARDEANWDTKLNDSINAVKATADAAQPSATLDASVTAVDANAASALRVQQDARLSATIGRTKGDTTQVGRSAALVDYDPTSIPVNIDNSTTGGVDHHAFPSGLTLRDGRHLAFYSSGTAHAAGRTGQRAISSDDGATWTTGPVTPTIAGVDEFPDGTLLGLKIEMVGGVVNTRAVTSTDAGATWTDRALFALGVSGFTYPNDLLVISRTEALAAVYVQDAGLGTYVAILYTKDQGVTWELRSEVHQSPLTEGYHEPVLVLYPDGEMLLFLRSHDGGTNYSLALARSFDYGQTFSTPETIRSNASGRPDAHLTRNGLLILGYRDTPLAGGPQAWAISTDRGQTWEWRTKFDPRTGHETYMTWLDLTNGDLGVAYAIEDATQTSSTFQFMRFTRSLDAAPPAPAPAYPVDLAAIDTFVRANAATLGTSDTGHAWTRQTGALGITSNAAQTVAGSGTSIETIDPGTADGEVSADLRWDAGGLSGNGVVIHWVDSSNFIFAAIESAGAALRLKKVSSGVTTNLAEVTGLSHASEAWHLMRITYRGDTIKVYLNGRLTTTHTLTAADYTKYGKARAVGLRSTLDGHRFANFTVRRAFLDTPTVDLRTSGLFIPATSFELVTGTPNKIGVPGVGYPMSWQLDAATSEGVTGVIDAPPLSWGAFDIVAWWTATNTGAGDVRLQLLGNWLTSGALPSANAITGTVTGVTPGVAAQLVKTTLLSGQVPRNNPLHMRVLRLGADAADTYASDIALVGIELVRAS